MGAEITEFKGNKVLVLKRNPEDNWPFQFGISKAKLVLDHLDDIKRFVEENEVKETKKVKIDLSNEMPKGEEETIE